MKKIVFLLLACFLAVQSLAVCASEAQSPGSEEMLLDLMKEQHAEHVKELFAQEQYDEILKEVDANYPIIPVYVDYLYWCIEDGKSLDKIVAEFNKGFSKKPMFVFFPKSLPDCHSIRIKMK